MIVYVLWICVKHSHSSLIFGSFSLRWVKIDKVNAIVILILSVWVSAILIQPDKFLQCLLSSKRFFILIDDFPSDFSCACCFMLSHKVKFEDDFSNFSLCLVGWKTLLLLLSQNSVNLYGFQEGVRPTERKELFTVHRPRHLFLPHQKVVFWLFEGKFSFFKKYMNFSRSRTNLQGQDCSHRKALSYQYAMFWIILYCYCGCHTTS